MEDDSTPEIYARIIPEGNGPHRLGRHVFQDSRSAQYDVRKAISPKPIETTIHYCLVEPWDQGSIGACTAFAALGCLMTEPLHNGDWNFTDADCLELYRQETRVDNTEIPGSWEPDDTGSTGLWSMKVLKHSGYIKEYLNGFHFSAILQTIMGQPVSFGTNWYDSMFYPDSQGRLKVDWDSPLMGGHQVAIVGIDMHKEAVLIRNSWGPDWGVGGYAWLHLDDFQDLLHQSGDITVPVVSNG